MAIGTAATLVLAPDDGPWWEIVLGGARTVTRTGVGAHPAADAVISGPADQLYPVGVEPSRGRRGLRGS